MNDHLNRLVYDDNQAMNKSYSNHNSNNPKERKVWLCVCDTTMSE
jgi:hypothetical protein